MYPILELSGGKWKCIPEVLYHYTSDHPLSIHNLNNGRNKQINNENYIKTLTKYHPIV